MLARGLGLLSKQRFLRQHSLYLDPKMFQFRLPKLPDFSSWAAPVIKLPKAEVHDIEERPEKRARTLKHLIKADFINHSILYNNAEFHNHTPHILGSAYILGAESDDLQDLYDAESKSLEPWRDSPGEIAKHDWRDFLGKKECVQRSCSGNLADCDQIPTSMD